MEHQPMILHIDLGNQSLTNWLKENKYVIYSELIRFSEMLINQNLDEVQAIMVSNLADNIVFVIKRKTIHITLKKAMNFFLEEEEFEKCAKIRDLQILIEKLTNESTNTEDSGGVKRNIKNDR
jgi:excinuclease UvrABC nuclease subunit